ncbi:3815_t:CDS:2, partial [Funneliformis caledonium]
EIERVLNFFSSLSSKPSKFDLKEPLERKNESTYSSNQTTGIIHLMACCRLFYCFCLNVNVCVEIIFRYTVSTSYFTGLGIPSRKTHKVIMELEQEIERLISVNLLY